MERCVTREIVYDGWRVKILLEILDIFIKKRNEYFNRYNSLCFRIHNLFRRGCKCFQVRNITLQNTR
jgi:hypothetical protein